MKEEIKSGIYIIRNERNQKMYVGSGIDLRKRKREHKNDLEANRHANGHLQNAFNKYGLEAFTFNVVECVLDANNLIPREQFYMDYYKTANAVFGYNLCSKAGSVLGYKHTEESRKQMSEAHKGKKLSEDTKKKMSEAHKGKKRSIEVCSRLSEAHKGKKLSMETRKKMSESKKGEKNQESKLSEVNVIEIRKLISSGSTLQDIGDIFDVTAQAIYAIKCGKTWSHIK
jgi:group I intron endonuclease